MSEKDKMLAGELYDANYDKELIEDRYKAKLGKGSNFVLIFKESK